MPNKRSRFSRRALYFVIAVTAAFIAIFNNQAQLNKGLDQPATETQLDSLKDIKLGGTKGRNINIEHWTTSNGSKVYFVQAPELPMLDIRLIFDAGSARDGSTYGVAKLTNGLLGEGSEQYNVDDIAREFESIGAHFSNSSHRDMAIAELRTLTDDKWLGRATELFIEVISKPSFPEDSFNRLQSQLLLSLQYKKQSPGALKGEALSTALYGDHPYAHQSGGNDETLQAMTLHNVQKFYERYYVSNNTTIALVGNIDKAQAQQLAEKISSALPLGEKPAALETFNISKQEHIQHIGFPSSQTHIAIGTQAIHRGHPDYIPLYVGNYILGGSGLTSLLFDEVREQLGLSYSISSHFSLMRATGSFIINMQTKTSSANEALNVTQSILKQFVETGPTQEQLNEAKQHITGSFPLKAASNSSIVGYLGVIGFYNMPLDYLNTFNQKIEAVTLNDITRVFQKHIKPEKMIIITVGQTDVISEAGTTGEEHTH